MTFTTVPKSAAKHGTKYYGKLWKGPRVAAATRKGLSVLMPPRTSSTVLCRTENRCTCPLHLPAFDSWQLKCTLYTFFFKLFCVLFVLLLLLMMMKTVAPREPACALFSSFLPSLTFSPLSLCLSVLPLFRTNWCCLCANILSRNTP